MIVLGLVRLKRANTDVLISMNEPLRYRGLTFYQASFAQEALEANVTAFIDAVVKAKPSGAKGTFVRKIAVSSTMGPGVKIDFSSVTT